MKKPTKKPRILLVNLPWQRDGRWGVRAGSRWPHIKDDQEANYLCFPFFLAYATSLLQKHGIGVVLKDALAEQTQEDSFLEEIKKIDFDYLVAETSVPSFYNDLRLLKQMSSLGAPIILCGPNVEAYKESFLEQNPFISFVLYGEYEFSLLELAQALSQGSSLSRVRGLIYRDNGKVCKTPPGDLFNLDLLPWPHRETLPMEKYIDSPGGLSFPSVQMLASRGCPFKCLFCLWPQVMYSGRSYRTRDVKDTIDEMEYLVKRQGFKSVYFDDDTFNIGKERMIAFCRQIRERGLDKTQWAIMARPDLMDAEVLEEMKKSGLWAVKYGVESSSQELITNSGKDMNLSKAEEMINLTNSLGIKVHLAFTFGLPGETKETIERTIDYAIKLEPFSVQFSLTTPFPGTAYYQVLEKQCGIAEGDLSCYDGNLKSVIRFKDLCPQDLEIAKQRAYARWERERRKIA